MHYICWNELKYLKVSYAIIRQKKIVGQIGKSWSRSIADSKKYNIFRNCKCIRSNSTRPFNIHYSKFEKQLNPIFKERTFSHNNRYSWHPWLYYNYLFYNCELSYSKVRQTKITFTPIWRSLHTSFSSYYHIKMGPNLCVCQRKYSNCSI